MSSTSPTRPAGSEAPIEAYIDSRSASDMRCHNGDRRGIVVLPLSTARFYTRPDVTFARIDDVADDQVCLAWHSPGGSR